MINCNASTKQLPTSDFVYTANFKIQHKNTKITIFTSLIHWLVM